MIAGYEKKYYSAYRRDYCFITRKIVCKKKKTVMNLMGMANLSRDNAFLTMSSDWEDEGDTVQSQWSEVDKILAKR